jgi:hypothetical protein
MPPSASAVDFFQLFVPDNALKNMVVQTNMYARKFQERFGSDSSWAEVTLAEMKAFLGYVISTGVSHCESVLSIWSGGFYSNRSLALAMSQARFEKILKYFHIVAFRSSQTTHGLYKVQPFLDSLQSGFDAAFRPSQTQVRPAAPEEPVALPWLSFLPVLRGHFKVAPGNPPSWCGLVPLPTLLHLPFTFQVRFCTGWCSFLILLSACSIWWWVRSTGCLWVATGMH